MAIPFLRDFLKLESAAGLILMVAALLAILVENVGFAVYYDLLLTTPVSISVGKLVIAKPLLLWINDGLMAVFFFLVGLELKREVVEGELASMNQLMLPGIAAVGGMAVPAVIYVLFNIGDEEAMRGWAIPAATDIAFALGILALLGSRIPVGLKIFLTALAIIDDLGAIVIIAIFYTVDLSTLSLAFAAAALVALLLLNLLGVTRLTPYMLVGLVLWVCVLKSGVHATLAGVALAMAIPLRGRDAKGRVPLHRLEHALHPWVAYFVLPVFGFANAGLNLSDVSFASLAAPIPLGIALGLFVGKQIGVFGGVWLAVRLGLTRLPEDASWTMLYGVCLLTGIGFTMSLFIGGLAFDDVAHIGMVKLGVLVGSILSGVAGYAVLRVAVSRRRQSD
jgi:NhaA family Na+:H+ antiporter